MVLGLVQIAVLLLALPIVRMQSFIRWLVKYADSFWGMHIEQMSILRMFLRPKMSNLVLIFMNFIATLVT